MFILNVIYVMCNESVLPIIFTVFLQLLIYLYIDCDLMNLAQSI